MKPCYSYLFKYNGFSASFRLSSRGTFSNETFSNILSKRSSVVSFFRLERSFSSSRDLFDFLTRDPILYSFLSLQMLPIIMGLQDFKSCEWHDTATHKRDGIEQYSIGLFYKPIHLPQLTSNKYTADKQAQKLKTKKIKIRENYAPFWVISFTTPAATVVPMSRTAKRPSSGNV
jgi:hypothetical protein